MGFPNNFASHLSAELDSGADATSYALDSDLVYLTSGDAVAWRFIAPATTTVVNVWAYVSGVTGTPTSPTNDLTCHLCSPAVVARPGTSLASTTGTARTSAGWVKFTFSSPPSVTIGNLYFLVIGQGTTGANYHSILNRQNTSGGFGSRIRAYADANGFASAATAYATPVGAVKFGNGMIIGNPFTSGATSWSSGTYARGLYIPGFSTGIKLAGVTWEPNAQTTVLKIYEGAVTTGGSAKYELTLDTYAGGGVGMAIFAPISLQANVPYRFVIVPPSNETRPRYLIAENVASGDEADFQALMPLGGCATYDNSGSWVNYNGYADLRYPLMGLLFDDTVAAAGGGLLVHPGMSGGMRG